MKYQRKIKVVEAQQVLEGQPLPPGVNLCRGGELAIRVTDMSHDNPEYGDYIVYPESKVDEEGEPTYPQMWPKERFEQEFELISFKVLSNES